MIKDKRQDHIIASFDQGKIPELHSMEEQEYAQVVQVLKRAGQKDLTPDPEFINSLEAQLLEGGIASRSHRMIDVINPLIPAPLRVKLRGAKGGDYFMANWFEKLTAKPWLLAGIGVVVLFIVSTTVQLPMMPFGMMTRLNDAAESSVSISSQNAGSSRGYGDIATVRDEKMMVAPDIAPMPPIYSGNGGDGSSIVKNASLDLEVKDVNKSVGEASAQVESIGGVVTNSSVHKTDDGYTAYLSLRVPAAQFQTTIQYLRGLAVEIVSENISSYDQSPQVDNTEDQLDNLRRELTKYQTLMEEAKTTNEKLNLQTQIDRVEREIRDYERQSQNLENNEDYSYITLSLREGKLKLPIFEELGLGNTIEDAVRALKRFVLWLVVLGIWGVVFTPIWLPIYLIVRRRNKK